MNSVRKILNDNWLNYIKNNKTSTQQRKEVSKMLICSKSSCNSRLCSSCGKRYADIWSDNLVGRLDSDQFSHVVLTVPSYLRPLFKDWKNLDVLMKSSRDFLKQLFLVKI